MYIYIYTYIYLYEMLCQTCTPTSASLYSCVLGATSAAASVPATSDISLHDAKWQTSPHITDKLAVDS